MLSIKREEEIRNNNLDKDGEIFCHECVELLNGLTHLRMVKIAKTRPPDPKINFKHRLFQIKGALYLMRARLNQLNCLHALYDDTCVRCVMFKLVKDAFDVEDQFYGMK